MTPDSWTHLKQFTAARIALGRAGASISTRDRLDFQLAHARARDAVLSPFNPEVLAAQFDGLQVASMVMTSCVPDRATYLRRPDLGRRLSDRSRADLELVRARGPWDLSIVVSDGLSAFAAMEQSLAVLSWLLPRLLTANWRVAPLVVMANARVAVQDEVGGMLGATQSLMLLGERPGLGSPDSLGAYLIYQPGPGKTDAHRNCVSNIRPAGLSPELAAAKLFYLLNESRRLRLSGVELKDESSLTDLRIKGSKSQVLWQPEG